MGAWTKTIGTTVNQYGLIECSWKQCSSGRWIIITRFQSAEDAESWGQPEHCPSPISQFFEDLFEVFRVTVVGGGRGNAQDH